MKRLGFLIIFCLLISCGGRVAKEYRLPKDFQIQYKYYGSNSELIRTIFLKKGECYDIGKAADEGHYKFIWQMKNTEDFEMLYATLKKNKVFEAENKTTPPQNLEFVETIEFLINGKSLKMHGGPATKSNESDLPLTNMAIGLVLEYTVNNRLRLSYGDEDLPDEMPSNFSIESHSDYHDMLLTSGACIDVWSGTDNHDYHHEWDNTDIVAFRKLYKDLKQIHAFTIKCGPPAEYESQTSFLKYTINEKIYIISGHVMDNDKEIETKAWRIIDEFIKKYSPQK